MGGMYDTIWNVKGDKEWGANENHGANYYAYSPAGSYTEASTEIYLPTSLVRGSRNAFIALGIFGPCKHNGYDSGVDLGISSTDGTTWQPSFYDPIGMGTDKSEQCDEANSGPGAKRATIRAWSVDESHIAFEVQFYDSQGRAMLSRAFERELDVTPHKSWNRFYRFASLVPIGSDNRQDGTEMMGTKFTRLALKGSGKTNNWGLFTNYVEHAYIMYYPKCAVVDTTATSETVNIKHA